jgi:hypothetical protein
VRGRELEWGVKIFLERHGERVTKMQHLSREGWPCRGADQHHNEKMISNLEQTEGRIVLLYLVGKAHSKSLI